MTDRISKPKSNPDVRFVTTADGKNCRAIIFEPDQDHPFGVIFILAFSLTEGVIQTTQNRAGKILTKMPGDELNAQEVSPVKNNELRLFQQASPHSIYFGHTEFYVHLVSESRESVSFLPFYDNKNGIDTLRTRINTIGLSPGIGFPGGVERGYFRTKVSFLLSLDDINPIHPSYRQEKYGNHIGRLLGGSDVSISYQEFNPGNYFGGAALVPKNQRGVDYLKGIFNLP